MSENGIIDNDAANASLADLKALYAAKTARPVPPSEPAPVAKSGSRKRKTKKIVQDLVEGTDIANKVPEVVERTGKAERKRNKPTQEQIEAEKAAKVDKRDVNTGRFEQGNAANPHGRKGKSGDGGVSMRYYFVQFWNRLNEQERESMWLALFQKAANGDIAASKLLLQFNNELDQPVMQVESDTGVRISLTVPQREA